MSHRQVDEWLRDGRSEPMPSTVRAHLDACDACRASLAEVEETQGWFEADEEFALPDGAAAEMRFTLEAAAREPRVVSTSHRGEWVARTVTGTVVLAAAAALVLFFRAPVGIDPELKVTPVPLAVVTAQPGVVELESKAPHESHRMVDGTAHFEVRTLREGESFVVHVGGESVHVRGTSYRVEAEEGRLMAVRVSEGVVEVALDDVPNPMLHAGEEWVRSEHVETTQANSPTLDNELENQTLENHTLQNQTGIQPVEPTAVGRQVGPRAPSFDQLFQRAWALHRASRSAAAAAAFDRLLDHPDVGEREADVLFWSAQSHLARGNETRARARLQRLVARHPDSLRANDARRQLGDL